MAADRKEYLRTYLNAWRKKKKAEDQEAGLSTPIPESTARRRACRECGDAVEAKSYWYCHAHNRLIGQDDDLLYVVNTNLEAY